MTLSKGERDAKDAEMSDQPSADTNASNSQIPQANNEVRPRPTGNDNQRSDHQEEPIHERDEPEHPQASSHHTSPPPPGSRSTTGLRILCLHDAHSSASALKAGLTKLGDRLYEKHGIDLVYINSPLCATMASDTDRVWYETDRQQRRKQKQQQQQQQQQQQPPTPEGSDDDSAANKPERLIGLDASLCLLQQMWASMPFWGILGIGQGAAIGSLLSLLPNIKPRPKFGIFLQGEALIQEAECLVDADDWSCLHILGTLVSGQHNWSVVWLPASVPPEVSRTSLDDYLCFHFLTFFFFARS